MTMNTQAIAVAFHTALPACMQHPTVNTKTKVPTNSATYFARSSLRAVTGFEAPIRAATKTKPMTPGRTFAITSLSAAAEAPLEALGAASVSSRYSSSPARASKASGLAVRSVGATLAWVCNK